MSEGEIWKRIIRKQILSLRVFTDLSETRPQCPQFHRAQRIGDNVQSLSKIKSLTGDHRKEAGRPKSY